MIKHHVNFLKEKHPELFKNLLGIFAYGSMNYNLFTEKSDVDTKAIYIPSFDELILKKPISKELHLENGEHCEVKDIRLMFQMWKKQNVNFLELFETPYHWINLKYRDIWGLIWNKRKFFYTYDLAAQIKSVCYQCLNFLADGENIKNKLLSKVIYFNNILFNFVKNPVDFNNNIKIKDDYTKNLICKLKMFTDYKIEDKDLEIKENKAITDYFLEISDLFELPESEKQEKEDKMNKFIVRLMRDIYAETL